MGKHNKENEKRKYIKTVIILVAIILSIVLKKKRTK